MHAKTRTSPSNPSRATGHLAQVRQQIEDAHKTLPQGWRQRASKERLLRHLHAAEQRCRPPAPLFDPEFDYPF